MQARDVEEVDSSDLHDPVSPVTTLLPMFPDSNTLSPTLPVTARHGRSGPSFKSLFPTHRQSSEVKGQNATTCRGLPASRSCALNIPLSHLRMSESSWGDLSHHHGNDSDDEGSVAASHASEMPVIARYSGQQKASMTANSNSRQSLRFLWTYHR